MLPRLFGGGFLCPAVDGQAISPWIEVVYLVDVSLGLVGCYALEWIQNPSAQMVYGRFRVEHRLRVLFFFKITSAYKCSQTRSVRMSDKDTQGWTHLQL